MVAAVSSAPNLKTPKAQGKPCQNPTRTPLLPSESGNNVAALRRPKPREVSSRYLSTSSSSSTSASSSSTVSNSSYLPSRRCASPIVSRARVAATPSSGCAAVKRSQSAERRRSATPKPNGAAIGGEMSATAKMLLSSKRSLSVSFQGESFSMPIAKSKPTPSPNLRKPTPERRKTTTASTTPRNEIDHRRSMERQPWPSGSRQVNSVTSLSKSVDLGGSKNTVNGRSRNVVRDLNQSLNDGIGRIQSDGNSQGVKSNIRLMSAVRSSPGPNLESGISDTESVSSDNSYRPIHDNNVPQGRAGGIIFPGRFWQESSNRLRRLPEANSPVSRSSSLKATTPSSPQGNRLSRGLSPMRGMMRPSSPCRPSSPFPLDRSSPSRGGASPSRVRNAATGTLANNGVSVLSFTADFRRGKVGESKVGDVHLLKLMYNRQLQWRFANARAEAALSVQQDHAQRIVYNAWRATSDLRLSVTNRRLELSRLKLKFKLAAVLKKQMLYLDEWHFMEKDCSTSLQGAIESLNASTIRLPIVSGAMVNIQDLKDAICSAVDVLQAMASSIRSLLSKAEQMTSLLAEMASVSSTECTMLDECKIFLSDLAALQVKDCSLRTHILQQKRVQPTCS